MVVDHGVAEVGEGEIAERAHGLVDRRGPCLHAFEERTQLVGIHATVISTAPVVAL
jgi:hypothetical protein